MNRPTNKEIIEKWLYRYRDSIQSIRTRRSVLNYFFGKKYFGYNEHIFDIKKRDLIDYFDYLNHLDTISLRTKKTKWTLLKSLLNWGLDYYEDDYELKIRIPKSVQWKKIHKEPKSTSDVFMTIEEIEKILKYLKINHYYYYLIFRCFAEWGARKGGVINADYDKIDVNKRLIKTREKNGMVVYYFSKNLADHLKIYLQERKLKSNGTKALFLSNHNKRYTERAFNHYLKSILPNIGIEKNITCHAFRRSLNKLRIDMGCPTPIPSILLNKSVEGVNYESYFKKVLKYKEFIGYYDKWNPYNYAGVYL
ncbi:MAG: tyrosine-type recombinase/integrase [Promethearchaeota archaeon]